MSSQPAPAGRPAQPQAPAVVILGADAILAARPATATQLANACLAAGYIAAVPASWGDELVAEATLKKLASRGDEAIVLCSCPRVAERLRRLANVRPHMLPFVSPPVAAARYLRARAGMAGLHITYVGDCPGAVDPSIDRYATPAALMRSLAKRNIVPVEQPTVMDERKARDGRRFYSLPGGVPAPNWIYAERRGESVVEPDATDFIAEVAHRITKRERCVIDLATRLGCACAGAVPGAPWPTARTDVMSLEPERAVHEVLDHDVHVEVAAMLEPWPGTAANGSVTPPAPLSGLAAQYNPEAKAPVIRSGPASPVPYPQPSARASGQVSALGTPVSSPAIASPNGQTNGHRNGTPAGVPSVTPAFGSPAAPAPVAPQASAPREPATGGFQGTDRRKWDGIERRTGWVDGRPTRARESSTGAFREPVTSGFREPVTSGFREPMTGRRELPTGPLGELRTQPLRQTHTFIRVPSPAVDRRKIIILAILCSALVASATSVATTYFSGRSTGKHDVAPAPAPAAAVAQHDSAAAPSIDSVAAVAPQPEEAPAPVAPLERTPIGPANPGQASNIPVPRPRRHRPSVASAFAGPHDSTNAATVIAPGRAPVPRASTSYLPVPATTAATPAPTPTPARSTAADDSATALKAEIEARRHRVDSLARIVDSLRKARLAAP